VDTVSPKVRQQAQAMVQTRYEWGNWKFYALNLAGKLNPIAQHLPQVESIECGSPSKIGEGLKHVAQLMAREVKHLRSAQRPPRLLEGGSR